MKDRTRQRNASASRVIISPASLNFQSTPKGSTAVTSFELITCSMSTGLLVFKSLLCFLLIPNSPKDFISLTFYRFTVSSANTYLQNGSLTMSCAVCGLNSNVFLRHFRTLPSVTVYAKKTGLVYETSQTRKHY